MSDQMLRLFAPRAVPRREKFVSVGRHLIEQGTIAPWQLFHALDRQSGWNASLTDILRARGWIDEDQALDALAGFHTAQKVDLSRDPPDPRLAGLLSPEFCLHHSVLPWASLGGLVMLVTSRPDRIAELRAVLPANLRGALVAVAREDDIRAHITRIHRRHLTRSAEARVPPGESCRGWRGPGSRHVMFLSAAVAAPVLVAWTAPGAVFAAFLALALLTLFLSSGLKVAAFIARLQRGFSREPARMPEGALWPRISVLVPLYREREIAGALISRLSRLRYPAALLDVLLVLEERDDMTREAIEKARLPDWIQVIEVPAGSGLTTKPRALNYALDFCRGEIIGIWDAEDAPQADQLEHVARRFAIAPPEVGCLQGILDYYNPYTNWISRCFTIEYSTWFRVILPGIARMGFAVPLGGTTVFLRREAIERVNRWDAHNVTEDADLGIRLARYGYRTDLIHTVTYEEANCRPWRWIRQRSRWLKGYMVTYLVHMRRPRQLLRQLGHRRFWGFQLFFGTAILQFLLAPLIWCFWLILFGLPVPQDIAFTQFVTPTVTAAILTTTAVDALVALFAISRQGRGRLMPWVITMPFYFPMATVAAYKALLELVVAPFYWDKTDHGQTPEGQSALRSDIAPVKFQPGHESL
ncbi:hypothetical protein SAMN04490248_10146 [Salinihabitans flavidus]|uniref:Glycosyltransferase, catalytic subunit of cellulose synthase and poly-beta-1,6-N-acetylglucosamine synthase n=1 Tax=Salinihabitans flavidus TaxID=569882 RepID=A0A1H8L9C2_9RHOB|nr:glycosyltransferase family 2 protein [Salinihabitans flavidus]SEO01725.1 hypothetical protein SAMN04490248_10146 [Salinihabitans flavidus]